MAIYCAPEFEQNENILTGIDTTVPVFDDYKTAKYHKLTDFIIGEVFRKYASTLGWTPFDLINPKALNKLIAGIRDSFENASIDAAEENQSSPFWEMSNEALEDIQDTLLPSFQQFIGHYFRFNSLINNAQSAIDEGTLDLTGTTDDTSTVESEIGGQEELKDLQGAKYERPGNDISAVEMASRAIKLIFRLVPKAEWNEETKSVELVKDNDGLPTTADFGPVFNKLLMKLAGTKSYEDMMSALKTNELLRVVPEAKYIGEILKINKPDYMRSRSEYNLLNEFYQQFSKPNIQVQSALRQKNGIFSVVDEINGNITGIKEQFASNFQMMDVAENMKQYLKEDELHGVYIDNSKLIPAPTTYNQRLDFLSLLGIKFTGIEFLDNKSKKDDFEKMLNETTDLLYKSLAARIKAKQDINDPLEQLRSTFTTESGATIKAEKSSIDRLVEFESRYSSITPSLSTRTANGELAYLISLDNQLSVVTYHLNNSETIDELLKTPPFRTAKYNPLFRNSYIIQFLFDENGNRRVDATTGKYRTINLSNLSGYKQQVDNKTISKLEREMSSKSKFIQDFNMMLTEGKTDVIRPEVSHSFFTLSLTEFDGKPFNYFSTRGFLSDFKSNSRFKQTIYNYLNAEIKRVKSYEKKKQENPDLPSTYKEFSIFYETLEQDNTALRDELLSSGQIDIDSPLFDKFMKNYEYMLTRETINIEKEIDKLGIDQSELYSKNLRESINKNIKKDEVLSQVEKDALIRAFVANTMVQNIEFSTLYGIDPLFTNEYHKRLKGVSSTGDLAATHSLFTDYRKSQYETNFHDNYSISGALGKAYRNNDSNFQTKTLIEYKQSPDKAFAYTDDQIIDDIIDSITKRDGVNTVFTKDYVTNQVLKGREDQKPADGQGYISLDFHRELSLRHAFNNNSNEIAYKYEGLIFRRDILEESLSTSQAEELETLEQLIYKNPNKYTIPVLKFTYWGGIENTTIDTRALDKLSVAPLLPSDARNNPVLKKLMQDMANKQIGYVKYKSGTKLYTTTPVDISRVGEVDPDLYSTELLKMQIRPKSTQNDSTSIPTQLLKLIFSNLFNEGKPVNEKVGQLYKSYIDTLKGIQGIQGEQLFGELGISSEGVDMKKLSERLIDQAKKQGLNSNVINSLQVEAGSLKGVLEESGFVKQIIDLVSGLADSRLRRWQMPGGDFVLVSNANRGKLNFYKYNQDGPTNAADIRITLNGEFIKLLKRSHPDGKPIGTLQRLNALLKDDNWREKNRKSLTVTMGRVPIQGPNSMEFGLVKEFLSPTIGNVVILPEEIVFKSGLDFDYDKQKVLTPSFTADGSYIENLDKVQEEIDKLKAERQGLITEFYNTKEPSETFKKISAYVADVKNIIASGEFDRIINRNIDKKAKKKHEEFMNSLKGTFVQIANLEIAKQHLQEIADRIDKYSDYDTPVDWLGTVPDARFEEYTLNEITALRDEINNTTEIFYSELNRFAGSEIFNVINEGYKFRDRIVSLVQMQDKRLEENFNKIIEIYRDVLSLPEMFAELVTPNSTKTITPAVEELTRKKTTPDKPGPTINLPTKNKVFNYLDNLHVKDILFAAKSMMAPFAVDNTYMQMMQYLGININSEYQRKWGKNKDGTPKYVSRKINNLLLHPTELDKVKDGNIIRTSLRDDIENYIKQHYDSEAINITIDSAKDPRFALLNIVWENVGVVNFMKNIGYPFSRIVDFINQPVLLKYFELRKNGLSKIDAMEEMGKILGIQRYLNVSQQLPREAYQELKNAGVTFTKEEKIKGGLYNVEFVDVVNPSVWDIWKLLRDIDNHKPIHPYYKTVKEAINYDENIIPKLEERINEGIKQDSYNLRLFAHFIAMDEHNQAFRNFHYYFNNDKTKTSTPTDIKSKDNLRETLMSQKLFSNEDIERFENESIVSAFMNNDKLKKLYTAILPVVGREDVQDTLDNLYQGYLKNFGARNDRDLRNMPKVLTSDFITAILFNFNTEDGQTFLKRNMHLLIPEKGKKTIAKRLDALRKQPFYPQLVKKFPILDQFVISNHRVTSNRDLNGLPYNTLIRNIKLVKPASETAIEEESTINQLRDLMTYKIKSRKYTKEERATYNQALHGFVTDLFNVGLLQSGMDKTYLGFSEYIPTEYKRSLFAPALQYMKALSPASFSNFLAKFESQFRYNNPKFFPFVKDDVHTASVKNNNDYSQRFKIYDIDLNYKLENPDDEIGEDDAEKDTHEISQKPDIYSQLGNKTATGNVVIKPWAELKDATKAITNEGIISTRIRNGYNWHFGNPFTSDKSLIKKGAKLIETNSTKESVEKYINWILTGETGIHVFGPQEPDPVDLDEQRGWILEKLQSGELKGKPILYYKELGQPSHATALDYLINKYNWKQQGGQQTQIQPENKPPIDPKCK